jgi:hypothetical protein
MEKLSAKQTVSSLAEAEAIKQAQEGDAAAFITDNLTSEQILSEDYFRFADNPGVGPSMTTNAFIDTNHARLLAGRRGRGAGDVASRPGGIATA